MMTRGTVGVLSSGLCGSEADGAAEHRVKETKDKLAGVDMDCYLESEEGKVSFRAGFRVR
jgi:hypothetical protein